MPKTEENPAWSNRIVGYGELSPRDITRHDKNWKDHPSLQAERMEGILEQIGWVQTVIVNRTTNKMIDGHLRVSLAEQCGEDSIPVTFVELTEEEELNVLATFDPIGFLARRNQKKFDTIQDELTKGKEHLEGLQKERAEQLETISKESLKDYKAAETGVRRQLAQETMRHKEESDPVLSASPELSGAFDLKPDMMFEFGLPYDIPQLLPEKLSECPEPIHTWTTPNDTPPSEHYITVCSNGNCRNMPWEKTILCFYTDDHHFENIWAVPSIYTKRLVNRRFYAVCTPDFTIAKDCPKATIIWQSYRQKWTGRYWQEAGIRIIPSVSHLTVDMEPEMLYTGIPTGAPCVSVELHSFKEPVSKIGPPPEVLLEEVCFSLQSIVKYLKPQSLLVYGRANRDEMVEAAGLPKSLHIISVPDFMTERSHALKHHESLRK